MHLTLMPIPSRYNVVARVRALSQPTTCPRSLSSQSQSGTPPAPSIHPWRVCRVRSPGSHRLGGDAHQPPPHHHSEHTRPILNTAATEAPGGWTTPTKYSPLTHHCHVHLKTYSHLYKAPTSKVTIVDGLGVPTESLELQKSAPSRAYIHHFDSFP